MRTAEDDAQCARALRAFAVLQSVYALGRWVSPPVPLHVIAMQSVPVIAALFPGALRARCGLPTRAVLGLALLSNVLLVALHLPAVVDMVRNPSLTHECTHARTH